MMDTQKEPQGELSRIAVRVHHWRPLIALALGAAVAGVYLLVGDTLYLVPATVIGFYVHLAVLRRCSMRHTAMKNCRRCANLGLTGPIRAVVNRVLTWYFHRRILDSKAAMLIVAAGIVTTVFAVALGKPRAVLPFLITYEVHMVQFALFFRSLVVHRGNEASCHLCIVVGDDPHPYGRVHETELKG